MVFLSWLSKDPEAASVVFVFEFVFAVVGVAVVGVFVFVVVFVLVVVKRGAFDGPKYFLNFFVVNDFDNLSIF